MESLDATYTYYMDRHTGAVVRHKQLEFERLNPTTGQFERVARENLMDVQEECYQIDPEHAAEACDEQIARFTARI